MTPSPTNIWLCKGRFLIDTECFKKHWDAVLEVMSKCLIVRCEHKYALNCFEYYAYSEEFDEVENGDMPPDYEWVIESGMEPHCQRK